MNPSAPAHMPPQDFVSEFFPFSPLVLGCWVSIGLVVGPLLVHGLSFFMSGVVGPSLSTPSGSFSFTVIHMILLYFYIFDPHGLHSNSFLCCSSCAILASFSAFWAFRHSRSPSFSTCFFNFSFSSLSRRILFSRSRASFLSWSCRLLFSLFLHFLGIAFGIFVGCCLTVVLSRSVPPFVPLFIWVRCSHWCLASSAHLPPQRLPVFLCMFEHDPYLFPLLFFVVKYIHK